MSHRVSLLCLCLALCPGLALATPPAARWAGPFARGTYRGSVDARTDVLPAGKSPTVEPATYKVQRRGDRLTIWVERPLAGPTLTDAAGKQHTMISKSVGRVVATDKISVYGTTVLHVVFDDPKHLRNAQRFGDRALASTGYQLPLKSTTGTALLAFHDDGRLVVNAEEKTTLGTLRPLTLGAAVKWPLVELGKRLQVKHGATTTALFKGTSGSPSRPR